MPQTNLGGPLQTVALWSESNLQEGLSAYTLNEEAASNSYFSRLACETLTLTQPSHTESTQFVLSKVVLIVGGPPLASSARPFPGRKTSRP